MRTLEVIRLQNGDGYGPYDSRVYDIMISARAGYTDSDHAYSEHCPLPLSDGMDGWSVTAAHYFGFIYRRRCLEWFFPGGEADAEVMTDNGLQVTFWEVPNEHVILGIKQVAFLRDQARKVRTCTPVEFVKELS